MCGIFGFANYGVDSTVAQILGTLLDGLQRLEYRGYDSAGVCVDAPTAEGGSATGPLVIKHQGKISDLRERAEQVFSETGYSKQQVYTHHVGIGHTRWATHGPPSAVNSHPHVSGENGEFVVVHNGIIANYAVLKPFLEKNGAVFVSDTDTEVVPHLCEYLWRKKGGKVSLHQLAMEVCSRLEGAYALLIKSARYPNELVACKQGSPLVYGTKKSSAGVQLWLSSDSAALLVHTRDIVVLEDGDVVYVGPTGASAVFNVATLTTNTIAGHTNINEFAVVREEKKIEAEIESIMKGGYDHYMQKEIHEQPKSLADTMRGRVIVNKPLKPRVSGVANVIVSGHHVQPCASTAAAAAANGAGEGGFALPAGRRAAGGKSAAASTGVAAAAAVTIEAAVKGSLSLSGTMAKGAVTDNRAPGAPAEEEPYIRLGGLLDYTEAILRCRRVVFIACGTSYHACLVARKTLEEFAAMPVVVELAGDFMDREAPVFRDDTCVFVSQSGETADTLRALDYAKAKGALCVGVTNTVGSAISNATHCGVHLNAGYEIGVASTKAYTSQIVALTMMALMLGSDSVAKSTKRLAAIRALELLPTHVKEALKLDNDMKALAAKLKDSQSLIFFGRGYNYSTALEAALKVKEVALIHSEGINAGEMKHGPLALVDENLPILVIASMDSMHRKMESVIQQLLARKARLVILCNTGDATMDQFASRPGCELIRVPRTVDALQPIVNIVPLQLLSYHLTTLRGFNVDQPRNLAKSVTVTEE